MTDIGQFYINGKWVDPAGDAPWCEVINPSTEEVCGRVRLGSVKDVDAAVDAARHAFESFSRTTKDERVALLSKVAEEYQKRLPDIAKAISAEMGAPDYLANAAQAPSGLGHIMTALKVLKGYEFESAQGTTGIVKEPVGVCGFITPWNWPVNQIMCKIAPALATGCTMVLKPSEVAPMNAAIVAEILDAAGVPAGVFNLVNGDGPGVGEAISAHPGIDMVSFTGSTRAGRLVAKSAADSVKRVTQELGGKSANIILDDADITSAVTSGVKQCFLNTGQSCNAPTRMLVPSAKHSEACEIAKQAAETVKAGAPDAEGVYMGPVVSKTQWEKVQNLIQAAIDEGATLVTGGVGRPDGLNKGYFVRPTVFGGVSNDMTIAREEVFGPVLSILPYSSEEEAIQIANDTDYGLSGYVQSGDLDHAKSVASHLRTGNVHINGAGMDSAAPFGGYKQSGNGREWGSFGFEEFLEVKAIMGYAKSA